MNFTEAIKTCFKKYATFSGRARRSEFWYWVLFRTLLGIVFNFFIRTLFPSHLQTEDMARCFTEGEPLPTNVSIELGFSFAMALVLLLPGLAVAVRRLHDTGKSGWHVLSWYVFSILLFSFATFKLLLPMIIFALISFIYGIILLVWFCKNSQAVENKYGPNPKELES